MFKYVLGNSILITTKDRYEKEFKDMGYLPYQERKEEQQKHSEPFKKSTNIKK